VAAVLVFNTPDDGRLRPKHVEWLCRNKTCTVLHQVGVSFDLHIMIVTPTGMVHHIINIQLTLHRRRPFRYRVHQRTYKNIFIDDMLAAETDVAPAWWSLMLPALCTQSGEEWTLSVFSSLLTNSGVDMYHVLEICTISAIWSRRVHVLGTIDNWQNKLRLIT